MDQNQPITVGTRGDLQFTIDFGDVLIVFQEAPKIAHYWLHGFFFDTFLQHRLHWLRRKKTSFGRGSDDPNNKATKVWKINEGPDSPRDQDVLYRVRPANRRAASVEEARRGLQEMSAEASAGGVVLPVHEFGEDIDSKGKLLAVPIKTRPKTVRKWMQKFPNKRLEYRPSKKFPGEGVLYEITKVRGRPGRPRKGETLPKLREKLRLRFVLKRMLDMHPTLRMYATWDELASSRDTYWKGAVDKMHKQLQAGDPRDFK